MSAKDDRAEQQGRKDGVAEMSGTETTDGNRAVARRAGRGARIALILSLTLNLVILGVIGGSAIGHHRRAAHEGMRDVGFSPFTGALDRDDRAALRGAFLAAMPDARDRRQQARQDFGRLAAALRADPWDRAEVSALLARNGQRTTERLALGHRLLIDRIEAMTPEARAAFADRIEAGLRRGPGE